MNSKVTNHIQVLLDKFGLNKLLLNSGQVFIRRLLGMSLSFLWVFLLTNLFGSKVYGLFSISQVLISFLGVIFCIGIDTAIVKLGSTITHFDQGYSQSNFFSKAVKIILISSLLCCTTMFLVKNYLSDFIFSKPELESYFEWIAYLSFLFIFHKAFTSFLTVQGRFKTFGNYYFLFPNIGVFISILTIYLFNLPPHFIVIGYLVSYGTFGLIQAFSIYSLPSQKNRNIRIKEILKLSSPMMISSSFIFISSWTDILMLGAMVSEEEVGVYNAAFKIGSLILIIIATINSVLAPKISALYDKNDIESLRVEIIKATKIISYLSLPVVTLMIIFRSQILRLFGEEFVTGEYVLIIISLGMLFNALSGSVGQILNMTSFQKQFRNFTIISAVTNIVLNYFLIKEYGILGAALASFISNIVINTMCLVFVKRKFNFYAFFRL